MPINESVRNADNYATETLANSALGYSFMVYMAILLCLSVFLLFREEASHLNKIILKGIALLIGFWFLIYFSIGQGFGAGFLS
jgi:positive regulator of sigma E activity